MVTNKFDPAEVPTPLADFPDYGVTRDGRVYRITGRDRRGRWHKLPTPYELKFVLVGNVNYLRPAVSVKDVSGKSCKPLVSRLIMMTFGGPPEVEDQRVRFKDGDRFNNHIDNLEWQ